MANYVSTHTGEQIDSGVDIALTNVITKDNTTPFTPTGNYNPATKKYVDDAVSAKVGTTGDESIGGVKTFTSFPVTPSSAPGSNYQVSNKKYVDDIFGGIHSVPSGGTTNQSLSKIDATDYNVQWITTVIPAAGSPTTILYVWCGSQAQYDAIGTKDGNTFYIVL